MYSKPLFMQFLLNTIAFYYTIPVFYKISQINQYEYYAEPTDKNMKCFNLKKYAGIWIAEGGYTDWQASQIGEQIDKLTLNAIKN